MGNEDALGSTGGRKVLEADTVNKAGGRAGSLPARQALAEYVCTSNLGSYPSDAGGRTAAVLQAASHCSEEYLAKLAVYARVRQNMVYFPALLCAILACRGAAGLVYLRRIFSVVVDNGIMLRVFCRIIRSGAVGRKSFGTRPKILIQEWLIHRPPDALFWESLARGPSPSIAAIIRMVHPKPQSAEQNALFRYLLGYTDVDSAALPVSVRAYETFRQGKDAAQRWVDAVEEALWV
jgi:60 kDa SS-A/Ro ribonucleoprotein